MVNKRQKSTKSKRVTLKKKCKILKKVREHHKKKAKEAKKVTVNKKQKIEKDTDDSPLTEQELKALEARRARAVEASEQKKAVRVERKRKIVEDDSPNDADKENAKPHTKEFVKSRDNSERPFYKELVKVIEASDVIVEVLDARDPLGTRCIDMEKMVSKSGPEKHLVLLLNKIDLVPREAVEKWLKYLREELPAVAFKCSTQEQRSNYGWKSAPKSAKPNSLLQTSDCLGAETLIKLLKNYSRSHEIKKSITVGIIGLPNVGKSSLINSLRRCHVVNVGATPGLTRSMQEVQLDKNVKLLDCPGVVMLKSGENDASVALKNCKRIEKLDDPVGPVKEILKLCATETFVSLYKIQNFDSAEDFLQKVAIVRGKLKKGGVVDIEAAARIVLHDWNEGKIPYYTLPPSRDQEVFEANIVSELGKEFNVDEVYKGESSFIGSLKSVEEFRPVDVLSSCPPIFEEKMVADELQPEAIKQDTGKPEDTTRDDDQLMNDNENEDGTKAKTIRSRQNEKLYTAVGILNPRLLKAEKKRRKKASKAALKDAMDADDDFNVDLKNKNTQMDIENDAEDNDHIRYALISGADTMDTMENIATL